MSSSKWFGALVALALLASPSLARAGSPAVGKNLLLNPDFERTLAGHEWMPAGWDTSDSGLPTVFFGRDTLAAHTGSWCVNVANTSTVYSMGHNWNQTVFVGREAWGKQATFSIWTRSLGQQGRAYVMVQAYSDTLTRLARLWGVDREEAAHRLGIAMINDPLVELGWQRAQWTDGETPWTQRQVSVFVPPGTNVLYVRAGLFGTGQVAFDDASLTLGPPPAVPTYAPGQNLLADPSFENGALAWEWVIPPYEGMRVDADSTTAHDGRFSMRCSEMRSAVTAARMGMSQRIPARGLGGKRLRISGWFKGTGITSQATVKLYCHTLHGMTQSPGTQMYSETFDWSQAVSEVDVPDDVVEIWAWLMIAAPADGTLWLDDAKVEVIGDAQSSDESGKPAKARVPKHH